MIPRRDRDLAVRNAVPARETLGLVIQGHDLHTYPENALAQRQAAAAAVCSARGLARLYAMCISEVDGIPPILSRDTLNEVTQIQTVGDDLVLRLPTRYAIVFQKPDDRLWYGSHQAFGHDGAGGSIGIADPWYRLAYAWIPRRMSFPGGADPRGLGIAKTLRGCLPA